MNIGVQLLIQLNYKRYWNNSDAYKVGYLSFLLTKGIGFNVLAVGVYFSF